MTTKNQNPDAQRDEVILAIQSALINSLMQISSNFAKQANENEISYNDLAYNLGSAAASIFYEYTRKKDQPLGTITENQAERLSFYLADYTDGYTDKIQILSSKEKLNDPDIITLDIGVMSKPKKI